MTDKLPLVVDPVLKQIREISAGEQLPAEILVNALMLALTGLTTADSGVVTATDNLLQAIGKVQGQLNNKVGKDGAKVLSDNNFTNTERVKLANIAEQATKNATDAALRDRSTHTGDLPASAVPDNLLTPQKTKYLGRHAYGGLTTGSLWLSGAAADPRASETVGANVTSVLLTDSGTVLARRNAATTWRFSNEGSLTLYGAGLEFAGTALSTNARTLDFYEEGTFVPTIYGATTAGAPTYASNVGNYTRIGDTVFWSAVMSISAIGGMVGALRIGGLPFAISAPSANIGGTSVGFYANLSGTSTTEILANHANGTSNLRMYKRDSSSTGCTELLAADIGETFRIYLSGNYKVA